MNLRKTLDLGPPFGRLILIACAPDQPVVEGKFILGRTEAESEPLVLVFDTQCEFHRDLALKYGLRPSGGGWCRIDHAKSEIWLSGRSSQFGSEPNRTRTRQAFEQGFPGYFTAVED